MSMMKILAIDTATEACSAAVLIGEETVERFEVAPRGHGQLILGMVEEVLAEAGLRVGDLDALAFGRGPGAFTGVRIATGVIQGIGFAADLPIAPVSTLATLARVAWRETGRRSVLAAIDARIDEVYCAAYEIDAQGIPIEVEVERVCAPHDVPRPAGEAWLIAGTGWNAYQAILSERLSDKVVAHLGDCLPRARDVVWIAAEQVRRGALVSAEAALPVYLRDQVAVKSV